MDAVLLKTNIEKAMDDRGFNLESAPLAKEFVDIISKEVVKHIQDTAIVSGSVTVNSVTGVTTGPGVSGPGTGSMIAGNIE